MIAADLRSGVERLGDMIVRPGGQRLDRGRGIAAPGQHDHGQIDRIAVTAEFAQHLHARQTRHHHIKQHQIEPARGDEIECFGAIVAEHRKIAEMPEPPPEHGEIGTAVIDHEDGAERAARCGRVGRRKITHAAHSRPRDVTIWLTTRKLFYSAGYPARTARHAWPISSSVAATSRNGRGSLPMLALTTVWRAPA